MLYGGRTANQPGFHIFDPPESIHQPFPIVISHSVDRKVPAFQVFREIGCKCHFLRMSAVLIFSVNTVSGYFKPLPLHDDRHCSVLNPRIDCTAEKVFDFLRAGGGGNIPVVRHPPKNGIPYAPAHRISFMLITIGKGWWMLSGGSKI